MTDNVADSLWRAAEKWPEQPALIVAGGDAVVSFAELRDRAGVVAEQLRKNGVEPGDRILVMLEPGVEFFATMFGLCAAGATAVLVDPGMGYSSMFRCLRSLSPRAIIGESLFHLLSWLFRTFDSRPFRVSRSWLPGCVSWRRFTKGEPMEAPISRTSEQLAVLAYTSGSTGKPKPVVMDHGTLRAQIEAAKAMTGIEPGHRQMAFIPLNALLGPGLGCSTVLPSVDPRRLDRLDPAETIDEMHRYEVSHCLGSPFIWRRIVGELEARGGQSLPLHHLLIGGAPPDGDLVAALSRLNEGEVSIAYGATEAVPITFGSARTFSEHRKKGLQSGCFVGAPVEEMEAITVVEGDEPRRAEPSEIGEVWIRGPLVSPGYDGFAARDHRVIFEEKSWHRTGDCGYFNARGELILCGRLAHCVHTSGGVLYPLLVEPVFENHPGVARAALVGLDTDFPQRAAIIVVPEAGVDRRKLRRELLEIADDRRLEEIGRIFFRRDLPMDKRHHSKILRHDLARWARKKAPRRQIDSQ